MRACRCGRTYAYHTEQAASDAVGLTLKQFRAHPRRSQIGKLIRGKWHFRRKELDGIVPVPRGRRRIVPPMTPQERSRYYYERNLEANRERLREYGTRYYREHRELVNAKKRVQWHQMSPDERRAYNRHYYQRRKEQQRVNHHT